MRLDYFGHTLAPRVQRLTFCTGLRFRACRRMRTLVLDSAYAPAHCCHHRRNTCWTARCALNACWFYRSAAATLDKHRACGIAMDALHGLPPSPRTGARAASCADNASPRTRLRAAAPHSPLRRRAMDCASRMVRNLSRLPLSCGFCAHARCCGSFPLRFRAALHASLLSPLPRSPGSCA